MQKTVKKSSKGVILKNAVKPAVKPADKNCFKCQRVWSKKEEDRLAEAAKEKGTEQPPWRWLGSHHLCPECVQKHAKVMPCDCKCGAHRYCLPTEGIDKHGQPKTYLNAEKGWTDFKRHYVCPDCKQDHYMTRTASIPVDRVLLQNGKQLVFGGIAQCPDTEAGRKAKKISKGVDEVSDERKFAAHPLKRYFDPANRGVKKNGEPEDWPETTGEVDRFLDFEALMLKMSSVYTDAVNFCLGEYYQRDPARGQKLKRTDPVEARKKGEWVFDYTRKLLEDPLAAYKQPYLYQEIRKAFPELVPHDVNCVDRRAWSLYAELRYKIIVHNTETPRVRYPYPILINAKNFKLGYGTDETEREYPYLDFKLDGHALRVCLSSSAKHFSRQLGYLDKLRQGEGKMGDLTLYFKDAVGESYHKRIRMGDGICRSNRRLDAQIAVTVHCPQVKSLDPNKVMMVTTSKDRLLVITVDGYHVHICNHPEIKPVIDRHCRRLKMYSEDVKFTDARRRRRLKLKRMRECDNFNNRMKSWHYLLPKSVAEAAASKGCGKIVFNTGAHKHVDEFGWSRFAAGLKSNCLQRGIEFVTICQKEESTKVEAPPVKQVYADEGKEIERDSVGRLLKVFQSEVNGKERACQAEFKVAITHLKDVAQGIGMAD